MASDMRYTIQNLVPNGRDGVGRMNSYDNLSGKRQIFWSATKKTAIDIDGRSELVPVRESLVHELGHAVIDDYKQHEWGYVGAGKPILSEMQMDYFAGKATIGMLMLNIGPVPNVQEYFTVSLENQWRQLNGISGEREKYYAK